MLPIGWEAYWYYTLPKGDQEVIAAKGNLILPKDHFCNRMQFRVIPMTLYHLCTLVNRSIETGIILSSVKAVSVFLHLLFSFGQATVHMELLQFQKDNI